MSPEEMQMLMGAFQMAQGQKQASLGAISQVFPRWDGDQSGGKAVVAQGQGTAAAGAQNIQTGHDRKEYKKAKKEADKKNGPWGSVGTVVGAGLGTIIPGVGNLAGAAIGAGLGGATGSAAMGNDLQSALGYGLNSGLMTYGIGSAFGSALPDFAASPYI